MKKHLLTLITIVALSLGINNTAQAYDEVGCSIWLCLPSGFPAGCAAAHGNFKHRLKKLKPPMPSWSSCSVSVNGSDSPQPFTVDYGHYIYENFGKGVVKSRMGFYASEGSKKDKNITYKNGQIIHTERACTRTTTTLIGVYSAGWSVSNTLNDYIHFEYNTGKPIEEVRKPFQSKVLSVTRHRDRCNIK